MDKQYDYVTLNLIDGKETGWISAYFGDDNLIVIKIPANQLKNRKDIAPIYNSGFYVIVGKNEDDQNAAYIGQASVRDNGKSFTERFGEHNNSDKHKIRAKYRYVISRTKVHEISDNFNAMQLNYLERKLIQEAIKINSEKKDKYIINNGKSPDPQKEPVDDQSRAVCDSIYDKMLRLLYSVGCNVFVGDVELENNSKKISKSKNVETNSIEKPNDKELDNSKQPIVYKFLGERHEVSRWVDLLNEIMEILATKYPDKICELAENNFALAKKKKNPKPYLTFNPSEKNKDSYKKIEIRGKEIYYNKRMDSDSPTGTEAFAKRLVLECCGIENDFEIISTGTSVIE